MVESRRAQKASGDMSFTAVVGQTELKEALLAVAADDGLDGLLVRGEKGTAKSTTVRALADLLPEQRAVADCPYGCPPEDPKRQCVDCRERTDLPVERRAVPLVTLPLGATRERVVGTLSVADALDGSHEFEPGLLARAHRGILYVDEVNLLDDHLVDVVLDAAASGVNRVERDAVSVTHPAEFTLVGTMNPEEGDLRPQLRDRFALQATVTGCEDIEDRVHIVERALRAGRRETTAPDEDDAVRDRLVAARERLADVDLSETHIEDIAKLCREAGVDGHRGDIATARAARAFAALDGRTTVTETDVRRGAELALPHRLQSRPFEDAPDAEDVLDDHFEDETESEDGGDEGESEGRGDEGESEGRGDGRDGDETGDTGGPDGSDDSGDGQSGTDIGGSDGDSEEGGDGGPTGPATTPDRDGSQLPADADADGGSGGDDASDRDGDGEPDGDSEEGTPLVPGQTRSAVAEVGESAQPEIEPPTATEGTATPGSRAQDEPGVDRRGPRVRTRVADGPTERVDAAATVRAATGRGSTDVESRDLRESVRAGENAALVVFVVDASASMRPAMRAAKGTVLELLEDAYQQRDEVAFVAFAGEDAEVLLPPTDSVTLAARHLKDLPTGDRTPLPAGLEAAGDVLDRADPAAGVVVLVTDGRTNSAVNPVADTRVAARALAARDPQVLVVDAGEGGRAGVTDLVVEETGADCVTLEALSADRVDAATGRARENQL